MRQQFKGSFTAKSPTLKLLQYDHHILIDLEFTVKMPYLV